MDPLAPLIDALHNEARLRVWSLVITIFGDLVQHRGGEISTARLGALTGRVGVEAGALRTALSRLGRDGWVQRERSGRTSLYRLTPEGLAQFGPATSRIFAPPRQGPVARWAMVATLNAVGGIDTRLCPADAAPADADCVVSGDLARITPAFRARQLDEAHRAALAALAADLAALETPLVDPLDAAAARMLLIHRWRRIVLRFPEPVAEIMPEDAPLADPRAAVARVYLRLAPRAEAWLDRGGEGLEPMPPADPALARRFAIPAEA